jgi:hypothetical protein
MPGLVLGIHAVTRQIDLRIATLWISFTQVIDLK